MNKKASIGIVGKLIILVLVLGIGAYLLYTQVLTPVNNNKNLTNCGNTIVGKGACKDVCEKGEIKLAGYGCSKDDSKLYCCIDPDYESEDYGGNSDYRFAVFDIGIDDSSLKGNCVKQPDVYVYDCSKTTVKVKMTVTNTGKNDMTIYANPKASTTFFDGESQIFKPSETKTLTADLKLESKKTYVVKAAAKCNTGACIDNFPDGVFTLNDDQWITINVK